MVPITLMSELRTTTSQSTATVTTSNTDLSLNRRGRVISLGKPVNVLTRTRDPSHSRSSNLVSNSHSLRSVMSQKWWRKVPSLLGVLPLTTTTTKTQTGSNSSQPRWQKASLTIPTLKWMAVFQQQSTSKEPMMSDLPTQI